MGTSSENNDIYDHGMGDCQKQCENNPQCVAFMFEYDWKMRNFESR